MAKWKGARESFLKMEIITASLYAVKSDPEKRERLVKKRAIMRRGEVRKRRKR